MPALNKSTEYLKLIGKMYPFDLKGIITPAKPSITIIDVGFHSTLKSVDPRMISTIEGIGDYVYDLHFSQIEDFFDKSMVLMSPGQLLIT